METLKNALGLNGTESSQEPVNAQLGAGTATEPYDGGNKEENVAATESSIDKPASAIPGTSPAAAAIVSDGAESEAHSASSTTAVPAISTTTNSVSHADPAATSKNSVPHAEPTATSSDAVPPALAVGASATKTADELSSKSVVPEKHEAGIAAALPTTSEKTVDTPVASTATPVTETIPTAATTTSSSTPIVKEDLPAAATATSSSTPVVKEDQTTVASPAPAQAVENKDKSIGTPGWFKNTLSRRKSSNKTLDETKTPTDKGPKVPEKDTHAKTAAVAAATGLATAAVVEEHKPAKSKPVETEPVETKPIETRPIETTPVETKPIETKAFEAKKASPGPVEKEKKHKRGKSVSETLKGVFGRKQSKVDKDKETVTESKAAVVPLPSHSAADESSSTAVVPPSTHLPAAEPSSTAPATVHDQAPVSYQPGPYVIAAPAASRYADDDIAPDEMPGAKSAVPVEETVAHTSSAAPVEETVAHSSAAPVGETVAHSSAVPATAEPSSEPILPSTAPVTSGETIADPPAATTSATIPEKVEESPAVVEKAPTSTSDEVAPEHTPATSSTVVAESSSSEPGFGEADPSLGKGKGASVAERRMSRPPQGENLSAIPVAGGIRLGTIAEQERAADPRPTSYAPEPVPAAKAEGKPSEPVSSTTPKRSTSVLGKLKSKLR